LREKKNMGRIPLMHVYSAIPNVDSIVEKKIEFSLPWKKMAM
jgi:hypothetical protein